MVQAFMEYKRLESVAKRFIKRRKRQAYGLIIENPFLGYRRCHHGGSSGVSPQEYLLRLLSVLTM